MMNAQIASRIATHFAVINGVLRGNRLQPLHEEQLECLMDEERHTEAWGMLDDLRARVGVSDEVVRPLYITLASRFGDKQYIREFPRYGALDFTVPEGFEDVSWHNDVCPSWMGYGYCLFTDYKAVEEREFQQNDRFALCIAQDEDREYASQLILAANDMKEIDAFITPTRNCTPAQRVFLGQRIARIKAEVVHAVGMAVPFYEGGRVVPLEIKGFSDLHEYCDANELGGLCEELIVAQGQALFPQDETNEEDSAWVKACNLIQNTVHNWIATGSMRSAALDLPGHTVVVSTK